MTLNKLLIASLLGTLALPLSANGQSILDTFVEGLQGQTDPVVVADPVTDPIVNTDPVVVQDPVVISDPVVQDPVISDPVVQDPVISDLVQEPVVEEPVVEEPVVEEPIVEEPVIAAPTKGRGKKKEKQPRSGKGRGKNASGDLLGLDSTEDSYTRKLLKSLKRSLSDDQMTEVVESEATRRGKKH